VTTDEERNDPRNDNTNSVLNPDDDSKFLAKDEGHATCKRDPKVLWGEEGEVITRPMSWEIVNADVLPANLDWRDKDGTNYVSWSTN